MKKMNELTSFVRTSRPLYWLVHFLFFVFGVVASGNFTTILSLQFIVPLFIIMIPYSYFVYAVNDYYDDLSDHENKRKGGVFGKVHTQQERSSLLKNSFICFALCGFCFSFFGIIPFIVYLVLSADLFWYSAPPIRFKGIPFIDFITGGSLYGGLMYLLGYVTYRGDITALLKNIPVNLIFIFVITAWYHLVLATFDMKADKKQGITTTPAVLGARTTLFICIFFLSGSLVFFYSKPNFFVDIVCRAFFCVLLFQPKWRENRWMQKIIGEYSLYVSFLLTVVVFLINPLSLN